MGLCSTGSIDRLMANVSFLFCQRWFRNVFYRFYLKRRSTLIRPESHYLIRAFLANFNTQTTQKKLMELKKNTRPSLYDKYRS